jgi:hypothetical protein
MKSGAVRACIARAADFYGPHADRTAVPHVLVLDRLMAGKAARWLVDASLPHSLAFTLDSARGMALLGERPEALGQVWHLPASDPPIDGKTFVELAAKEIGVPPRLSPLKPWMVRLGGLFNSDISESREMLYQYEREYRFDSTKITRAFGIRPTPYREGIRQTVAWRRGFPARALPAWHGVPRAWVPYSAAFKNSFSSMPALRSSDLSVPRATSRWSGTERCDVSCLDEDDVASSLPGDLPFEPDEGLHDPSAGEERQLLRQTEMSTWWTATVSGIPFSALTSRHSRIASSMFFRASLSLTPWLTHPGIAGHSATKTPSSSRSTVTTNFIRWILRRPDYVFGRFPAVGLHAESPYRGVRELCKVVELNGIEHARLALFERAARASR